MTWKRTFTLLMLVAPAIAFAQAREESGQREERFDVRYNAGPLWYTGEVAGFMAQGWSYGVSAGMDLSRLWGVELGYHGAAYRTEEIAGDSTGIVENGAQGLVRFGPEWNNIEPHALAGVAVTHLGAGDEAASGGLVEDGTLVRLPLGAGVSYDLMSGATSNLNVGARVLYSLGLGSEPFPTVDGATSSSQITGQLQVGGKF